MVGADWYGDPTPWWNKCPWLNIFFCFSRKPNSTAYPVLNSAVASRAYLRCVLLLLRSCTFEWPHESQFGRIGIERKRFRETDIGKE
jgi:hypothetical protein